MRDLFVPALLATTSSTMVAQATARAADHYEIVQGSQVSSAKESAMVDRTIGVCFDVSISEGGGSKSATASPLGDVGFYLREFEKFTGTLAGTATIAENPQHGSLAWASALRFRYTPAEGYRGPDKAAFLVDIGNRTLKIVYFIQVTDEEDDSFACEAAYWKISFNGGAANSVPSSFGYQLKAFNVDFGPTGALRYRE